MKRGFKGIWIVREIWESKELAIQEKCLFAEIDSLDASEDHCYASDEYFMEFMGCSRTALHRMLKKLRDLGYVSNVSFDGRKRVIMSNLKTVFKEEIIAVPKSGHLPSRNRDTCLPEIGTHITKGIKKGIKTTTQEADVSIFDGIEGISGKLKLKLSKEHSKENLEKAIRILKASTVPVPNPFGFIQSAVDYEEPVSKEEAIEKNRAWALKEFHVLQHSKLGILKLHSLSILRGCVEIFAVSTSKTFEYSSNTFKKDIIEYLSKLQIEIEPS